MLQSCVCVKLKLTSFFLLFLFHLKDTALGMPLKFRNTCFGILLALVNFIVKCHSEQQLHRVTHPNK